MQAFQIRIDGLGAAASALGGDAGKTAPAGGPLAGVFQDLLAALQPGEAAEAVPPAAATAPSRPVDLPLDLATDDLAPDAETLLASGDLLPVVPVLTPPPVLPAPPAGLSAGADAGGLAGGLGDKPSGGLAEAGAENPAETLAGNLAGKSIEQVAAGAQLQPAAGAPLAPAVPAPVVPVTAPLAPVAADAPASPAVQLAGEAEPLPAANGTADDLADQLAARFAALLGGAAPEGEALGSQAEGQKSAALAAQANGPVASQTAATEEAPKVLSERPVPTNPDGWETRVPEPGQTGNDRFFSAARDAAIAEFAARAADPSGAAAAQAAVKQDRETSAPLQLVATSAKDAPQPVQPATASANPLLVQLAEAVADGFSVTTSVEDQAPEAGSPLRQAVAPLPAAASAEPALTVAAARLQPARATTQSAPLADALANPLAGEAETLSADGPIAGELASSAKPEVKPVAPQSPQLAASSSANGDLAGDQTGDLNASDLSQDDLRAAPKGEGRAAVASAEGTGTRGTTAADGGAPVSPATAQTVDQPQRDAPLPAAALDFGRFGEFDDLGAATRTISGFLGTAAPVSGMPGDSAGTQSGSAMAQAAAAQVVAQMQSQSRPGQSRFQIRLDPAELGRIDVEMTVTKDGEVKAKLTVDKAETLDMFMRDQRSLERALEAAGLKPDQGGLQFSLRDEGGRSFNFAGQDGQGRSGQEGQRPAREADAAQAERQAGERVAQLYRGSAAGGLDIRI
ncbi:flagellar hook-length control protein FliK [Pannonibacter sp. SL95]|uniref:flagellar hook-length control protein FliK n=1 Tax=Pannonibacter sp. SL95 TaxID=2995153 RepID=UPI00227402C2|nr:flagellar hook-length control protein FliK [Pannonibacter sp. SL95]MCY1705276.1 flagellar hook-length control protein FliK [Pannonibacter sp. SL95]